MDDDTEHKKAKVTKKCVIKRRLMFENYGDCMFNNKIIPKSKQRFKSDCHSICTEQINKIALLILMIMQMKTMELHSKQCWNCFHII